MTVGRWFARLDLADALVAVVAALHLVAAFTLVAAPDNQLFTQGTRPVFDLFPPPVWFAAFLIGGLAAASLLFRVTGLRQVLTWITVLPTQTVWLAASILAVREGVVDDRPIGSAMGVVFLSAVLAFTAITAGVVAHDFTSGKR